MVRAPRRDVNRQAALRNVEIPVAFLERRSDVHAEIEQLPNALHVPDARERREEPASFRHQLTHRLRLVLRDGADGRRIVCRAGSKQLLDGVQLEGNAAALEQGEHVTTSSSRGHRDRRLAWRSLLIAVGAGRNERRVGAVVQQHLDDLERVVAQDCVVQGGLSPSRVAVGIHAVLEQPRDGVAVVPVGFAKEDHREAVVGELPAFNEDLQGGVVVRFGRVIRRLLVVGVRAPLDEQARQLRVVGDSGGPVQRALPLGLRLMVRLEPPGVRAGSGVEQRRRRPHEAVRSRAIEPEVSRETQVRQRIPAAGAALRRGAAAIDLQEPAYGRIVAENRGRMDVAPRDLGVRGQDRFRALERPRRVPGVERHACCVDKGRQRIAFADRVGHVTPPLGRNPAGITRVKLRRRSSLRPLG